jgi:FKBP-type peptidyl-prolyl cis-trans isomerase FklB
MLIVIAVVMGMGSCTSFSSPNGLKTDIDTMSYYFGLSRSEGIKRYLVMQAGVDTAFMDDFYRGFKHGAKNYSPRDVAYYEGVRIAHLINNQWVESLNREVFMGDSGKTVNRKAILSGFYSGVKHYDETTLLNVQTLSQSKMSEIKEAYKLEKYAESIAANEKFLSDNKLKDGVRTTPSGLQYKIITEGRGNTAGEKSTVKVNYRGRLIDGTEFDSSYKNNAPASFRVNQVIKGWTEALQLMSSGSKWELYIPQELAYGSAGQGAKIPPYATLIFEIELLEIEPEK